MALVTGASAGLDAFGFGPGRSAAWNYPAARLFEEAVRHAEGMAAAAGPLVVETGKHTGRSPRDKFFVREPSSETQVDWGRGNPKADLMVIGEAPGREEDLKGEPCVGRAGKLLTDIIKAMKLSREDVYIANVMKGRPPENRNPEPDELEMCRPYIRTQIELIKPRVIVPLDKFAPQSLNGKASAVSAARSQRAEYGSHRVMP